MYYGRDDGKIPKSGVHHLMLEEHIQKILDKAAEYHHEQLQVLREDIKREVKASIRTMTENIKGNSAKMRTNY